MRSLLHSPRQRKRSIAAATLGALALLGSLLVATPAQALNDTGTGGVFVPATGRFLDTGKNIGGYDSPMPAKGWRTIQVTGKNGVPDDGSVGAVSVVATAASISNQGILNGRPDASASSTLMGIYGGENKQNTSFSSVLAVAADGTIQVQAETSIRLILDLQGYYTANTDGTAPGGFVPLNGTRIADSRTGLGVPQQVINSGERVDLQVTGRGGIPKGASSVIINMIAVNRTASTGYLTPYATGDARPANSFNYAGSVATSMQAQVKLSADGKITIYNANSNTDLVVDNQGYFTAAGNGGAVFTPGAGRAYDTRSSGNTALSKNETRSIQIAGKAGVPVMGSGIKAVVLSLTALKSTAGGGSATVWADGTTRPNTTSINFDETTIRTNTITVPLGANGKVSINNVADATNYVFDIQGWYSTPAAAAISCDSNAADRTVLAQVPANPITCTVTAGPARASNEALDVSIDYGTDPVAVPLSETTTTSQTFTVPNTPGQHAVEVDREAGDGSTESDYTFTIGDWRQNAYPTQDATDAAPKTSLTPALYIAPTDTPFPSDVAYRYTVYSALEGGDAVAVSPWTDDAWVVPANILQDGVSYAWSAEIRGSYNYAGDQDSVTTPRFEITPSSAVTEGVSAVPANDSDTEQSNVTCDDSGLCSTSSADMGYTGWGPTTRKVVNKTLLDKKHRGPQLGPGCAGHDKGCDVEVGGDVSISIGLDLGITRKAVAGALNITATASVHLSVTCHSDAHKRVTPYFAGRYWKYKVHTIRYWQAGGMSTTKKDEHTSGWLYAFRPDYIDCVDSKS